MVQHLPSHLCPVLRVNVFLSLIFFLRNSENLLVRTSINEGVSRSAKLQGRLVVDGMPALDD